MADKSWAIGCRLWRQHITRSGGFYLILVQIAQECCAGVGSGRDVSRPYAGTALRRAHGADPGQRAGVAGSAVGRRKAVMIREGREEDVRSAKDGWGGVLRGDRSWLRYRGH